MLPSFFPLVELVAWCVSKSATFVWSKRTQNHWHPSSPQDFINPRPIQPLLNSQDLNNARLFLDWAPRLGHAEDS